MKVLLSTTGSGIFLAMCKPDGRWIVEQTLAGEEVTCLAADPIQTGSVFIGTRNAGVLHSIDDGRTWATTGLSGQIVKAIATSPLIPGMLFAGTKPACLFRSLDYGLRWEEILPFRRIFSRHFWFSPAEAPFTAYVQGIALSPSDPDVLVVGVEFGAVVRSTDGGKTWQDHRKGALRDCHMITFHSSQGNWVYEAGGTGAGTAISRDGGDTWVQNRAGLDRHYGWACAADPFNPEVSYLSAAPSPSKAHGGNDAQACIFRSDAVGKWKKLDGGLPQPLKHMPYALLTDPDEPGHVYAGLSNGDVWFSSNMGEAWEQLPFNLISVQRSMILLS